MTRRITLGEHESRALAAFCSRNAGWSPAGAARLVIAGSSVGVFVTPPWDVMAFAAVPADTGSDEPIDVIVSLPALTQMLTDTGVIDVDALPTVQVTPAQGVTLLDLPPRDGWQLPIHGISGDIAGLVEAGHDEVKARTATLAPRDTDLEIRRWWASPGWSGLTMGVLFAAHQLGMLPKDRSKVAAATSGPWKRLSTSRGQVFSFASGPASSVNLALIYPNGR